MQSEKALIYDGLEVQILRFDQQTTEDQNTLYVKRLYRMMRTGFLQSFVRIRDLYMNTNIDSVEMLIIRVFLSFWRGTKAEDDVKVYIEKFNENLAIYKKSFKLKENKMFEEIDKSQVFREMIADCQIATLGLTAEEKVVFLEKKVADYITMLTFLFPEIYRKENFLEMLARKIMKNIIYNLTDENINNYLKHSIIFAIVNHYLAPNVIPYKNPVNIISIEKNYQQQDLEKYFLDSNKPDMEKIDKAWEKINSWAKYQAFKIRTRFWSPPVVLTFFALVLYKFDQISFIGLLTFLTIIAVVYYGTYKVIPYTLTPFSHKEFILAYDETLKYLTPKKIEVEKPEGGTETITTTMVDNEIKSDHPFYVNEEKAFSYLGYAKTAWGLSVKEAKALQQKNNEGGNNNQSMVTEKLIPQVTWAEGLISSIGPEIKLSNDKKCYIWVCKETLSQFKADELATVERRLVEGVKDSIIYLINLKSIRDVKLNEANKESCNIIKKCVFDNEIPVGGRSVTEKRLSSFLLKADQEKALPLRVVCLQIPHLNTSKAKTIFAQTTTTVNVLLTSEMNVRSRSTSANEKEEMEKQNLKFY